MTETNLKHRIHTVPMKGDGQPIENAIGELYGHVDGIDDRLSKLEKGPGTLATRKAFEDTGGPAPEYFVPVDRKAGVVGGDGAGDVEGSPRALSRRTPTSDISGDTPEPEYFVPVDQKAGIIGGDE